MQFHFTDAFFMPVKQLAPSPEPSKLWDSAWPDVTVRALIKVEDILKIYCELPRENE